MSVKTEQVIIRYYSKEQKAVKKLGLIVLASVLFLCGCTPSESSSKPVKAPVPTIQDMCYVDKKPLFIGTTGAGTMINGTRVWYINTKGEIIEFGLDDPIVRGILNPKPKCDD